MKYFSQEKSPEKSKLYRSLWRAWFALLALVVVCILCGDLTTAWYQENQDVDSSDNITSAPTEIELQDYDIYYYSSRVSDCIKIAYSELEEKDDQTISLIAYDTVFQRNEKTAEILCIPITGTAIEQGNSFTLSFPLSDDSEYKVTKENEEKTALYLSNIIQIRCAAGPASLQDEAENEDVYAAVKEYLENETAFCYVTDIENEEKETEVSWVISDYDEYRTKDDILYVYLEIDYNDDLVNQYASEYDLKIKFGQQLAANVFVSDFTDIEVLPESTSAPTSDSN
jgi:hypothetical protein